MKVLVINASANKERSTTLKLTNPSSQSRISDVAKQLLRMGKTAKIIPEVETD